MNQEKSLEKKSLISYKLYSNERLKPVSFHGKEIYPLYVQVINERKPIYFKSYFYNLLSKEKYALHWIGGKKMPAQKQIIQKETALLDFLINKEDQKSSYDSFQKDYYHYGNDLLDLMDEGFKDYLIIFFADEGQMELSRLINLGRNKMTSTNLLDGFKSSLRPQLFKKLLNNAPAYASPYLPFYEYCTKIIKQDLSTFSLFQWELFKENLQHFLKEKYAEYSFSDIHAFMTKHSSK